MSRQHVAKTRGAIEVRLECDECGKVEWVPVMLRSCCDCAEWEGVRQNGWSHGDDTILCSQNCLNNFWANY